MTAQPPALSSLGGRVSEQGFPPLASSLWGQVLSCPGQWVRMRQKGVAGDQLQVCCSYTPVHPTPANTTLCCSLGQLRCGPRSQASGPSGGRTHLARPAFFLTYMFCTACSPAHAQCEGRVGSRSGLHSKNMVSCHHGDHLSECTAYPTS